LLRIQHHDQIRHLAVAKNLPDLHAFIGGLHRFEHRQGLQAQPGRALVTQPYRKLRRAGRRLDLHVAYARDPRQRGGDCKRIAIQKIE
jgi:hypothetical protein